MWSYLQLFTKITPICCHAHRVNHTWQEAKNWYTVRVTIQQTFCDSKEIELNTINIQLYRFSKYCVIYARNVFTCCWCYWPYWAKSPPIACSQNKNKLWQEIFKVSGNLDMELSTCYAIQCHLCKTFLNHYFCSL